MATRRYRRRIRALGCTAKRAVPGGDAQTRLRANVCCRPTAAVLQSHRQRAFDAAVAPMQTFAFAESSRSKKCECASLRRCLLPRRARHGGIARADLRAKKAAGGGPLDQRR